MPATPRRLAASAAGAALIFVLAACGTGYDAPESSAPTATTTPDVEPEVRVTVGDYVGLAGDVAIREAEDAGLRFFAQSASDFDFTVEEADTYQVLEQNLEPGARVDDGSYVKLTFEVAERAEALSTAGDWIVSCTLLEGGANLVFGTLEAGLASNERQGIDFCKAELRSESWNPTEAEAQIVEVAKEHSAGDIEAHRFYARAMEFCIEPFNPDRPAGLSGIEAAAVLCPDGPDGPAITAWASGQVFADGTQVVGKDIPAGTYNSTPSSDCYWERATANGNIIANDFITHAAAGALVTVREGETFISEDCGTWTRQ